MDESIEADLLERAQGGQMSVLDELLEAHRSHLSRLITLRLDKRVRARVDADDVLQNTLMEAARRIREVPRGDGAMSFRMWLRIIARQKVIDIHRQHLGAGARDVRREQAPLLSTAIDAAARFLAEQTSPSSAAAQAEERSLMEEALSRLDPTDREILVSRHIEQLTNVEVAQELGIDPKASSKRYVRAVERLRTSLRALDDP